MALIAASGRILYESGKFGFHNTRELEYEFF
jgi:hypothetical protein